MQGGTLPTSYLGLLLRALFRSSWVWVGVGKGEIFNKRLLSKGMEWESGRQLEGGGRLSTKGSGLGWVMSKG